MILPRDQVNVLIKNGEARGIPKEAIIDSLIRKGVEPEGLDIAKWNAAKLQQVAPEQAVEARTEKLSLKDKAKEAFGDIKQVGEDIFDTSMKRGENIAKIEARRKAGEVSDPRAALQKAGQYAGAASETIGSLAKGLINVFQSDKSEKEITEALKFVATEGVEAAMKVPIVKAVVTDAQNWYAGLDENQKADVDAAGGALALASEFIGGSAGKKAVSETIDVAADVAKKVAREAKTATEVATETAKKSIKADKKAVTDAVANSGIVQGAKDLAARGPRAVKRVKETVAEAKARGERIKTATPEVAEAMKSNLDERIINRVTETAARGDDSIKAYDEVLKIAEETPKDIGMKRQPSIVSGEIAAKQYDLINKQKQSIGKEIGETAKTLSKTEKLNMQDSFRQMDDTLSEQGIKPFYTKKGVELDFSGTKYTPAERTKIQELYNLATEGGDKLSPVQIRQKDQLFSKLKREANFEGVGNIIIETADGNKSLFDVFRDIYSSKLDTISPEIKALNSKYRKLSLLTDDIEDSIFKTPNFNVVKHADPAEFAKVNLRRIFGESQSSPVYEGVADAMDAAARGLGYKGASAKEVAEFAQEIRKLFPDTIPKTGFTGGIRMGVGDIIESASKIGAPNLKDQQQAIRKLLNSLTNK